MYKTILHPTDLQENHYSLCEQAVRLAKLFNAKIYLLHVIEPPTSLQIAQSLGFAQIGEPAKDDANAVIQVLAEALNVPKKNTLVEVGSAKQIILEKAKSLNADLIVIGSHNSAQFSPYLGSTAYAVVHHASCNVLTIQPKAT